MPIERIDETRLLVLRAAIGRRRDKTPKHVLSHNEDFVVVTYDPTDDRVALV